MRCTFLVRAQFIQIRRNATSEFVPAMPFQPNRLHGWTNDARNNYKMDAMGTDGDGKPLHVQYGAKFDGKDHPATGIANADSVSIRRIDANTVETLQKKDGKVVMTITSTTSKDGKTRTSTWRGKNAEGKDVHNVVVFDRQ